MNNFCGYGYGSYFDPHVNNPFVASVFNDLYTNLSAGFPHPAFARGFTGGQEQDENVIDVTWEEVPL